MLLDQNRVDKVSTPQEKVRFGLVLDVALEDFEGASTNFEFASRDAPDLL